MRLHGGLLGGAIAELEPLCLKPPWPWGHWLYGRILEERLSRLPGNLIECGVGKGGTSLFLGYFAKAACRKVFAFDSFEGVPAPDPEHDNRYFRAGDYSGRNDRGGLLSRLQEGLMKRGLDGIIIPVPGFLEDTLPNVDTGHLAFVHIDVDLFRSVEVSLEYLWPKVVDGGIVVIDDFFHHSQGPARAASAFFRRAGIDPVLYVSFPYSVVVVKGECAPPGLRRSIDGNRYSIEMLRRDPLLRQVVEASAATAELCGATRQGTNARRLANLLGSEAPPASSDIYEFWRVMEDYWDDMDADRPEDRSVILI